MDNLLRKVSSWLDDQRACADQLKQLASDVDSIHKECVKCETVVVAVGLVGAAAGLTLTLLTGGLAAPLALAAVGVLTAGNLTTAELIESKKTKCALKEAERLAQKSQDEEEAISRELQSLYKQGGGRGSTPRSEEDAVKCIMRALEAHKEISHSKTSLKFLETVKGVIVVIINVFQFYNSLDGELDGEQNKVARLIKVCKGAEIASGVFAVIKQIHSLLADLVREGIRMDKGGGSDVGNSLREAADLIEEAASKLKSDVEDVRRKLEEERKKEEERRRKEEERRKERSCLIL